MGYYPSNTTHDGKFRKIKVGNEQPRLQVAGTEGLLRAQGLSDDVNGTVSRFPLPSEMPFLGDSWLLRTSRFRQPALLYLRFEGAVSVVLALRILTPHLFPKDVNVKQFHDTERREDVILNEPDAQSRNLMQIGGSAGLSDPAGGN